MNTRKHNQRRMFALIGIGLIAARFVGGLLLDSKYPAQRGQACDSENDADHSCDRPPCPKGQEGGARPWQPRDELNLSSIARNER